MTSVTWSGSKYELFIANVDFHVPDYEQQRLHLLHKYGIDLETGKGSSAGDATRTRRMDRKEVERLMGGGDGQGGIFTWREKNSRKVRFAP